MAETRAPVQRPISPHLSIYKPMLTMMMSIVHRITGAALYFGTLLMVWWLVAAASGPNAYAKVQWFMGTWIGRLILFGYTWALIHHMFGGIRHFIWDTGRGYGATEREWLVRVGLGGSIVTTIVLWIVGYAVDGRRPMSIRTPLARVRGLGSARIRHRAFLAPAPDRGRQPVRSPSRSSSSWSRCSAAAMRR